MSTVFMLHGTSVPGSAKLSSALKLVSFIYSCYTRYLYTNMGSIQSLNF